MVKVDDKVMTEEEFEIEQQWAQIAGVVSTATGVHLLLMKTAGEHYAGGRDDIANAFRLFARDYEVTVVKPQSAALQKFINKELG